MNFGECNGRPLGTFGVLDMLGVICGGVIYGVPHTIQRPKKNFIDPSGQGVIYGGVNIPSPPLIDPPPK